MVAPKPGSSRRNRTLVAAAAALVAHGIVLTAMGLDAPRPPADAAYDGPVVRLEMLPPLVAPPRPAEGAAPRIPRLAPDAPGPLAGLGVAQAVEAEGAAAAEASAASRDYPGFYRDGRPGCGREDQILLTPAEKRRCRERAAALEPAQARAASLTTVFQLRPVPRTPSRRSMAEAVSLERPIPSG